MANTVQYSFKRVEKKYFLTPEQYERFLIGTKTFIAPDAYGKSSILNIYYDTDDYRLIRASIDKPIYKEKLRVRSYGTPREDGKVFVEIKKKFDGVVYKRRATCPADALNRLLGPAPAPVGQIEREIAAFQQFWHTSPKVFIGYDRIAYAGREDDALRITFDDNLRFRTHDLDLRAGDGGTRFFDDNRILMEIKIPGACPLWLCRLLSELKIYPTSFSKYGSCYCHSLWQLSARRAPELSLYPCKTQENHTKEALTSA